MENAMVSFLRITLLATLTTGVLSAAELLSFDQAVFQLEGRRTPGLEQVKTERLSSADSKQNGIALRWGNPLPPAIELGLVKPRAPGIETLEKVIVSLHLNFPREVELNRIVIRFRDSKGEIFQFVNGRGGKFFGKQTLKYLISASSATSIWGGDQNRKIDGTFRFHGIAVDFSPRTAPHAGFILESIDYQRYGEYVSFDLETGHFLNLLLPDRKTPPVLLVRNEGTERLSLNGTLDVEDAFGNHRKSPVSTTALPGETIRISLPGDYRKQGWWKVSCGLLSSSGKSFSGTHRFARMIPAGPTPGRARGFLFGICSHPERFGREKAEREALAAGLCGAKIMRVDFSWERFQAEEGKWDFSLYDHLVQILQNQGVEIQAILGGSVRWAIPRDFRPKCSEQKFLRTGPFVDPRLYGAFCGTIAKRYRNRIRFFEIWNEPDLILFANFEFPRYMELLRSGYDAIHRASPEATVMNGGIAGARTDSGHSPRLNSGWSRLLKEDGGKHFDLFAFHGHGPLADYRAQLELLKQKGLIGKNAPRPWYSNETAETSLRIGETEQAVTLFKKLLTAWAYGAKGYNWYNLREKGELYPVGHYERHFGLMTSDFEPKPAYLTFNMLAGLYRRAEFIQAFRAPSGITAYCFRNETGEELLALWNNLRFRPKVVLANLPPGSRKVDLFGNETPLEVRNGMAVLSISSMPFTVKTPGKGKEKIHLDQGFLADGIPSQIVLEPERIRSLTVPLVNPMREEREIELHLSAPQGVRVTPENMGSSLKAGEKRNAVFQLRATSSFSGSLTRPETLDLQLLLDGQSIERIPIALIRKRAAGEALALLKDSGQYNSLVPSAPGNEFLYWKGPDDLSAKIFLDCDGNDLRLRVDVTDDLAVQEHRGNDLWKGDSVQLGIALPGQKGIWKVGFARLADGRADVFCWNRPMGFPDPAAAIRLTVQRDETDKLTRYDVRISLASLGISRQTLRSGFRFNLIVNDNDGKLREGYLAAAPGMGTGEDSSLWPVVILE